MLRRIIKNRLVFLVAKNWDYSLCSEVHNMYSMYGILMRFDLSLALRSTPTKKNGAMHKKYLTFGVGGVIMFPT